MRKYWLLTAALCAVVAIFGCVDDKDKNDDPNVYSLSVGRFPNVGGGIAVTVGTETMRFNPSGSLSVTPGTAVELSALPNTSLNYEFLNWAAVSGSLPSGITVTDSRILFIMRSDVDIMAEFFSETDTPQPRFNLTVNSEGTGATSDSSFPAGHRVSINAGTAPAGKSFRSWTSPNTNIVFADSNSSQTIFIMPSANVTVTANFDDRETFPVTVISEGTGATSGANYAEGVTVNINAGTAPFGKIFKEWTTESAGVTFADSSQSQTSFVMPENPVTVTAIFDDLPQFTITYNGNGNTGGTVPVDDSLYFSGLEVTVLGNTGNLVKAGHNFLGWNTQANDSGTVYAVGAKFNITQNTTLYARWFDEALTPYTVTVNAGTGATGGGTYIAGAPVNIKAGTAPAGQRFASWTISPTVTFTAGSATAEEATFTMPASNVTVTAVWEAIPTYMLTITGGGTGATASGSHAEGVVVPINAGTSTTHDFVNWTVTSGTGGSFANADNAQTTFTMPGNAVTITANWTPKQEYTVTVNGSNASNAENGSGSYLAGAPVQLDAGAPIEGKKFKQWIVTTSTANITIQNPTNRVASFTMPANDVTVTAEWEDETYTLTTTPSPTAGGSITRAPNQTTYTHGTPVILTAVPETGYEFVNWTVDGTNPTDNPFNHTITANTTVTANFALVKRTLTVSVGTGSGTVSPSGATEHNHGTNVTVTATANSGYEFDGWSGDETGSTNPLTVTMNANKNITANFKAATVPQHAVTVTGGSSSCNPCSEVAPVTITATVPANHTFDNWTISQSVTFTSGNINTSPATFTMPNQAVTVTANFTENDKFTVTYDGNGATGGTAPVDPQSPYYVGSTVTVLGAGSLVRDNHTFTGWNTAANGSGTAYTEGATFNITANTTLYAQWLENPPVEYTVTVNSVGAGASGGGSYAENSTVNISAGTASGKRFVNWTSSPSVTFSPSADNPNASFTMPAENVTVTANFVDVFAVMVERNGGTITLDSLYAAGETVIIPGGSAGTPPTNQEFDYWASIPTVTLLPNANTESVSFEMPASEVRVTANYRFIQRTLNVSVGSGSGTVSVSPDGTTTHNQGSTVTITATPDVHGPYYEFSHWTGTTETSNPITVTMNSDMVITAVFELITPAAPQNVSASADSDTEITITWDAVANATGYRIYRSETSGSGHTEVGVVTTTSFTDTGLTEDTEYFYYVIAYNGTVGSAQSNTVNATTPNDNP